MKIRHRFMIYNLIMLITPILLIGVISVVFLIIFVMKYPVSEMNITRAQLLNPMVLTSAAGDFFKRNPSALVYVILWLVLCIAVFASSTILFTLKMSKSIETPVKTLTGAVDEIKSGNLSFEIMGSEYDELDRLCGSFDEMRQKLKRAEANEKRLKEERSMLLANISHDLKTPIASIRGYVEGLLDNVADTPEKQRRYLDTIYQKTAVIDSLINNLSVYSKLELSRMDFNFTYGDINLFLADLIEDYRFDLEKSNIRLTSSLSAEKAVVKIDYEKMGRVFSNLIGNSIKYKSKENSVLEIRSYNEEAGVYISIADNGIGINRKNLPKVFDSFYREDNSRTAEGSGLGLGIAKQIVEKHSGRLWLKSDGENKGTTAIVYLPYAKERSA